MKKRLVSALLLVLLVLTAIPQAFAGISGSAYVAGVGRYLWRGQILNDSACIQPGLSIGLNKFTLDWWGSYGINSGELTESDYRVSFSDSVPFIPLLSLASGFWIYTYPFVASTEFLHASSINNSQEIFATLSVDVPTHPYASFYYDAVLGRNGYAELGLTHELELAGIGINAAVNAGYNFGQYGYTASLTALSGTLGLSYSIAGIKINPSVTGQYALDTQYKSVATWSLNVSYEFGLLEDAKTSKDEQPGN